MNIQNVLLWLECMHGDVYAVFHSNSHINQMLPQFIHIMRFFSGKLVAQIL